LTKRHDDRASKGAHAPGHIRDAFLTFVFDVLPNWDGKGPEPMVPFEVNYEPRAIPISKLCGLLHNCKDILPGSAVTDLADLDIELTGCRTYAAAARKLLAVTKETKTGAA
jgi:hypothetical protein